VEFQGKGILSSGAKDAGKAKDLNVLVVGGGDAAIENALILSEFARSVTVVHRRKSFSARKEFIQRAHQRENITFITDHIVERFSGHELLKAAGLRRTDARSPIEIPCDLALIRIGVQPNSELFTSQVDQNEQGYIRVNSECETSIENVYAVGDVANPLSPTIATAVGSAATAVKHLFRSVQN
jgi:thioredoxin reductase (NADPH)